MSSLRSMWAGAFETLAGEAQPAAHPGRRWLPLLVIGLLQVAAGFLAMLLPRLASITAAVIFGVVLMLLSIVQIAQGFSDRGLPGYGLRILSGFLYLGVGSLMMLFPVLGVFTLTVFVAVAFIIEGGVRTALAIWLRPPPHWGLQIVGGLLGLAVGVLLLLGWSVSGMWVLGFLLGINLLISGSVYCALALAVRAAQKSIPQIGGD